MKNPEQQKEDLKNCPCCESSEVSAFVNDGYFSIACRACGVLVARNVEIAFAGGEAVKAWNTRPISAAELVEKARGWIPVEERLPEKHSMVLCSFCGIVSYGKFNGQVWVVNDEPDYSLVKTDIISFVTHWMPLPEPPVVESEVGKV